MRCPFAPRQVIIGEAQKSVIDVRIVLELGKQHHEACQERPADAQMNCMEDIERPQGGHLAQLMGNLRQGRWLCALPKQVLTEHSPKPLRVHCVDLLKVIVQLTCHALVADSHRRCLAGLVFRHIPKGAPQLPGVSQPWPVPAYAKDGHVHFATPMHSVFNANLKHEFRLFSSSFHQSVPYVLVLVGVEHFGQSSEKESRSQCMSCVVGSHSGPSDATFLGRQSFVQTVFLLVDFQSHSHHGMKIQNQKGIALPSSAFVPMEKHGEGVGQTKVSSFGFSENRVVRLLLFEPLPKHLQNCSFTFPTRFLQTDQQVCVIGLDQIPGPITQLQKRHSRTFMVTYI